MNTSIKTRPWAGWLAGAVTMALASGCSTVAEQNPTLDRAHANYESLQADPQAMLLAPNEMSQANEALRSADSAWTRRERRPTVDHLAYLAQQRVAIAREITAAKTWEKSATTAKSRSDLELARQKTTDKTAQLAVAQADAQQYKARTAELDMQLKELNAKQTDRGDIVSLGDVLFDSNQAEMRGTGQRDLTKLAAFFKQYPMRTALIEGFTDSQGNQEANVDLSQRRAIAVRDALVEQGVFADRLTTRGYGDAHPVASNGTSAGRQMNRRVEIVLSRDGSTVNGR